MYVYLILFVGEFEIYRLKINIKLSKENYKNIKYIGGNNRLNKSKPQYHLNITLNSNRTKRVSFK